MAAEPEQAKRESAYIVLVKTGDAGWAEGPTVTVSGGQQAARKLAVARDAQLADLIQKGDVAVQLAAVPVASWQPTEVRLEHREPRLVI